MQFFQTTIPVIDKKVVGTEFLARWRHSERGVLDPESCVPSLESHPMIDALTKAVLEKPIK